MTYTLGERGKVSLRGMFPPCQVEWLTLVEELLGHPVDPDSVTIHIYFEDALYQVFEEVDFQ